MVKQEPVSIKWQIVFMFIPFVSIWAYYRIEKLMSGIGLGILTYFISFGIMVVLWGFGDSTFNLEGSPFLQGIVALAFVIPAYVIPIWIHVHFMLKWARAWNQKVSHST